MARHRLSQSLDACAAVIGDPSCSGKMVGVRGFEPPASTSRT
jgi:hypothetical protein